MIRSQEEAPLSYKVVEAVAEKENVDERELELLSNAIDPDALDELFSTTRNGKTRKGYVRFRYEGYEIEVHGDSVEVNE